MTIILDGSLDNDARVWKYMVIWFVDANYNIDSNVKFEIDF